MTVDNWLRAITGDFSFVAGRQPVAVAVAVAAAAAAAAQNRDQGGGVPILAETQQASSRRAPAAAGGSRPKSADPGAIEAVGR